MVSLPTEPTPLMKQYLEIKAQNPDCVIFFRLGDFYEMFFEDAVECSAILKITLTSRSRSDDERIPMCGVPFHSAENYIQKLLDAGKKIAVCEQMTDPEMSKGLVERKVVRILTPALRFSSDQETFLASVSFDEGRYAISYLDLATGQLRATVVNSDQELCDELWRIRPKELLWPVQEKQRAVLRILEKSLAPILINFIHIKKSVDAIFHYLEKSHYKNLAHIQKVDVYETQKTMVLDPATIRNLELFETAYHRTYEGSLLWLIDKTNTWGGKRLLKQWLLYPLLDIQEIKNRQAKILEFFENSLVRKNVREILKDINDIERIIGRLTLSLGNARDLVSLKNTLQLLPKLNRAISVDAGDAKTGPLTARSPAAKRPWEDSEGVLAAGPASSGSFLEFSELANELDKALDENGTLKEGYSQELDELLHITRDGKQYLAQLEAQEKAKTGISTLKVKFNQVFGYYIEITKSHLHSVPAHYIRKQTLVNCERFITPELKEYENKILTAEEKQKKIERELFENLRLKILKEISPLLKTAHMLSELDVVCALAETASQYHYCLPSINDGFDIRISGGRHPVIERTSRESFVPNDIELNTQNLILIITGPNMAGKSTVMRQTALIVLLAQMGSFVPAKKATIGIVDHIFTRVGAQDILSAGESTFMVEMKESAYILKRATSKSLILMDEIGRGTSTYDGVSIAWAVANFIHDEIKAKTLFATHYHELTSLEKEKSSIKNFHVAVKEVEDQIIFLRKLMPGGVKRSYGVHVAKLAGLPSSIIEEAQSLLHKLETR